MIMRHKRRPVRGVGVRRRSNRGSRAVWAIEQCGGSCFRGRFAEEGHGSSSKMTFRNSSGVLHRSTLVIYAYGMREDLGEESSDYQWLAEDFFDVHCYGEYFRRIGRWVKFG